MRETAFEDTYSLMLFVRIPADVSGGLLGVVAPRGSAGVLGASEA